MKKLLLISAIIVLFTIIGTAQALNVDVTCNPEVIMAPDGSTNIIVACDEDATGSITVYTPGGDDDSTVDITISAGGSDSKAYPGDFPSPASTSEVGEYEVSVTLNGEKFTVNFWVSFFVIPEVPLGTLMATAACFAGLAIRRIKRK